MANNNKLDLDSLLRMNNKAVKDYIARLMPDNLDEVPDVLQDTLIKAWENFKFFNGEANFKTWLFTIARNTTYNYFRNAGRRTPLQDVPYEDFIDSMDVNDADFEDLQQQVLDAFTVEESPESDLIVNDMLESASDYVDMLEYKYQEVFQLRYLEDLDYREISEILSIPVGTVKKRLHDLNQLLQDEFNEYLH